MVNVDFVVLTVHLSIIDYNLAKIECHILIMSYCCLER